jgi:hypothetical protein
MHCKTVVPTTNFDSTKCEVTANRRQREGRVMERRRGEIILKHKGGSEISIRSISHISRGLDPLLVLYGLVSFNLQSL